MKETIKTHERKPVYASVWITIAFVQSQSSKQIIAFKWLSAGFCGRVRRKVKDQSGFKGIFF
jgi:hypothetical protein